MRATFNFVHESGTWGTATMSPDDGGFDVHVHCSRALDLFVTPDNTLGNRFAKGEIPLDAVGSVIHVFELRDPVYNGKRPQVVAWALASEYDAKMGQIELNKDKVAKKAAEEAKRQAEAKEKADALETRLQAIGEFAGDWNENKFHTASVLRIDGDTVVVKIDGLEEEILLEPNERRAAYLKGAVVAITQLPPKGVPLPVKGDKVHFRYAEVVIRPNTIVALGRTWVTSKEVAIRLEAAKKAAETLAQKELEATAAERQRQADMIKAASMRGAKGGNGKRSTAKAGR